MLVHPESIVHGLVEYTDGGLIAQLGCPDMRTPIAHALAWPERIETDVERLDLARIGRLHFEAPDPARFPALDLARQAIAAGGGAPAVLNAANEVAVAAFLDCKIGFLDIAERVSEALDWWVHSPFSGERIDSFEDVLRIDREARRATGERIAVRAAG